MTFLDISTVNHSPIKQFMEWFSDTFSAGVHIPEAMTLATVSREGKPSARIVLLKEVDERGFVFYTNYMSRKGRELESMPYASLAFHWSVQERQVRIEGRVEKVTAEESEAYFRTRPRESQISATISLQSGVVSSREELEQLAREANTLYEGKNVPKPKHWGGFRVKPERIEFWQGREGRLHDRIEYRLLETGVWLIRRLAP